MLFNKYDIVNIKQGTITSKDNPEVLNHDFEICEPYEFARGQWVVYDIITGNTFVIPEEYLVLKGNKYA